MIQYLTLQQILRLHDAAVKKFGGLPGIRDHNLLLSCVESPKMAMSGEDLYPSPYDKAGIYLFNIVRNYPFNDGNKRTGAGAAYLFLKINKMPISFKDKPYENFIVEIARGQVIKEEIFYFLEHGIETSTKK